MAGFWDIYRSDSSDKGKSNPLSRVAAVENATETYEHLDITGGMGEVLSTFQTFSDAEVEEEKEHTKEFLGNSKRFQTVCRLRGKRAEAVADNQVALRELQATYAKSETQMMGANAALAVTNTRQLAPRKRMTYSLERAQELANQQMEKIGQKQSWELEGD